MKCFLIFSACVCINGCAHVFGPVFPPCPIPPSDNLCASACEHLRDMGCEEGKPLEDGTTCETFCEETQANGHALRPSCVLELESCDMEECLGPRIFSD